MAEKELDFNRIINLNAEGDKGTSLSAGVYMGNASLVVFSNKQMAAKFPLHRAFITKLRLTLISLLTAAPGTKYNFSFSKYDMDTKKSISQGNLFVGKDDKSLFFFGVQAPNHPAMKFPIRSPLSFDLNDPMSDADKSMLGAQTIIDQLTTDFPSALMLTSWKRTPSPGGYSSGGGRSSGGEDIF